MLKDAEQDLKRVMGLDHDRPLVKCLDSIPPGNQILTIFCLFYRFRWDLVCGAISCVAFFQFLILLLFIKCEFCYNFIRASSLVGGRGYQSQTGQTLQLYELHFSFALIPSYFVIANIQAIFYEVV